jgi:serine protease
VRSVGVAVRQRAYAWATPGRRDFVVLEYSLKNLTADTLKPLYTGLFMDWDLPTPDGGNSNAAAWDSTRALGYCYVLGQPNPAVPARYAGLRLLRGGAPAVYSINNRAPAGAAIRLSDGFSLAEKFLTLSSGTTQRTAGLPNGADVSQVVGTRLARLAPGDSVTVAFAVLVAPTLPQLQAAADAAAQTYNTLLPARLATVGAAFSVYPNPTAGPLQVELPPRFGAARVELSNALGQVVLRQAVSTEAFSLSLHGLVPGLYSLRVQGAAGLLHRAVVVR